MWVSVISFTGSVADHFNFQRLILFLRTISYWKFVFHGRNTGTKPILMRVSGNTGGVIVNFRICGATYRTVSPSSRGVRSSDYVRCKALNVIFQKNKKVRKNIFSQKSYGRSKLNEFREIQKSQDRCNRKTKQIKGKTV